jgi:long-chain acyl-CoA synthetase
MNVANLLVRAGRSSAERPALAVGRETCASYGTLARRVASLAGGLRGRLGLAPGDRVAVAMRNTVEYVEVLFASWHAGLAAVPMNHKLHPRELEYVLRHSGARACLVTDDLASAVAPLQAGIPELRAVISTGSDDYRRLSEAEPIPVADGAPDDVAWLFYTSGTTGRPKGAMLTHRNLLAMTTSYFADVDAIAPGDCILHAAPMSHGSGLYILPHVAAAAKQVVPASGHFEPAEILDLVEAHPGMTFFAAPTMVIRLLDSPRLRTARLDNLKTIVYGGGPMYVEDCRRALDRLGNRLVQIYGQGESPMTITALSRQHHAERAHPRYPDRLASVGTPHTVVEVRTADAGDRPLPPGETGEILVRGDTVMKGYWNDPRATAETLRGGWLHTGDVGVFDEDGFLTLKDRSKDVIISGGSNVYPREVEEVLLRHDRVHEVSVVGHRHPEWGEEIVAFVVTRPGATVPEGELDALCLEHIARFKRPKRYLFIEALPRNSTGKVLKTELRDQLG